MFQNENLELKENSEKTFGKFCFPKIKKIENYHLKRNSMNVAISKSYMQASGTEKGDIEIRPTIPFLPGQTVGSERTEKNRDEFLTVTCRYRPIAGNSTGIIM